MTRAAGRCDPRRFGLRSGRGVGRVEVRRLGGELGGAGIDHRVARAQAERQASAAEGLLVHAGHRRKFVVPESGPLGGGEQDRGVVVGRVREPAAEGADLGLEGDVPAHLGEEPRGDPGRLLDRDLRDAPAEQPEQAPQPRVGRGEESAQDDRGGGPLGVAGGLAGLADLVDPADRFVLVDVVGLGLAVGSTRRPAIDAGQVVEARRPARILGQRSGARLLEPAESLVQGRPECPVDRHHLAGRLHLAAQGPVRGRELVEREARQLDDHVIESRLERGHGRAGDHVRDVGQRPTDRDLGGDPGDRVAGRLGREGRRARHARVDLDHRVIRGVRAERELDVAAALDAERPDDRECRAAEPLVDRVRKRLNGRDHDRVAGVNTERIDVLHRAHRDARVLGVAHHLVLDLLPADEALLDHHLADRAGPQPGPDPLAVGLLGLDDAAAGPAEGERRADDRGQPDRRERLVGGRRAGLGGLALDDEARGVRLLQPIEQVAERLAVLGHPDRLERGAEELDRVAFEDAGFGHGGGQVQGRLATEPGEQALGLLLGDHRLDRLDRQRFEVDRVGHGRVGHDRGRVAVDQDRPDALGPERAAGLGPGVVELGGLADDDRPGAEDQDAGGLAPGRGGRGGRGHGLGRDQRRSGRYGLSRPGRRDGGIARQLHHPVARGLVWRVAPTRQAAAVSWLAVGG